MASSRQASIRYAKSIFELAQERGELESVKQDMAMVDEVFSASKELRLILSNPIVRHAKKLAILRALFKKDLSELTLRFFEIITNKHRESLTDGIAKEFLTLYNTMKGIAKASVVTAAPLNEQNKTQIIDMVKKQLNANEVILEEKIEEDILGGYRVTFQNLMIDESISGRLQQLKKNINQNSTAA